MLKLPSEKKVRNALWGHSSVSGQVGVEYLLICSALVAATMLGSALLQWNCANDDLTTACKYTWRDGGNAFYHALNQVAGELRFP